MEAKLDDETDDDVVAAKILELCMSGSNEQNHMDADDILCELLIQLGYSKTVTAFEAVEKWYA